MKTLIESAKQLADDLRDLSFSPPVAYTYRTTDYTWEAHKAYLERFGNGKKRVIFLGMNPGPFGMAQTGVPFGEIAAVKEWMKLEAPIGKPTPEHPKRPIDGFACTRSEVSGRRLWGLFADRFPTADDFFKDHFVLNYCPLVWMSETGANITPDKIVAAEIAPVETACLRHLGEVIKTLQPEYLIGVGAYAEARLNQACEVYQYEAKIGKVLHPSPASPAANRGWAEAAAKQLAALGIEMP